MQKEFARSFESLASIYECVERYLQSRGVTDAVRQPVHFAIEELFTNMVKYNPGNTSAISIDVDAGDSDVKVTITDRDVDRFDVTRKRPVDTKSPLEERPVGGLGLHLVRHMVDTLDYHYADRQSRITFTKGPE